jgi:hypothetical protein
MKKKEKDVENSRTAQSLNPLSPFPQQKKTNQGDIWFPNLVVYLLPSLNKIKSRIMFLPDE